MPVRSTAAFTVLFLILALTACKPDSRTVAEDVSAGLRGKDITLSATGAPKARITGNGDLVIGGKKIDTNAEQRALLLAYRKEMEAIAQQGAEIGMQGAALGGKAAKEAIKGVFGGNPDAIGQNIEAEAQKLQQEAMKICERVATLKQAQDALAAKLPEFKPYANMDDEEAKDCRVGV
jgi:lipoate-protein ligase A